MANENRTKEEYTKAGYTKEGKAKHYDKERINFINILERVYGSFAVMLFCEMNAMKYRHRLGKKANGAPELDLIKAEWYEKAAAYYLNEIETSSDMPGIDAIKIDRGCLRRPLPKFD